MHRLLQHTELYHAIPVKTHKYHRYTPNCSQCSDSPHNADYLSIGFRPAPQPTSLCLSTQIAPNPTNRSSICRIIRQADAPGNACIRHRTGSSKYLHFTIPTTYGNTQSQHTIPWHALHCTDPALQCGFLPHSREWRHRAPSCPTVHSSTRTTHSSPREQLHHSAKAPNTFSCLHIVPWKVCRTHKPQKQPITTDLYHNLQTCPIMHWCLPQCRCLPACPTLTS